MPAKAKFYGAKNTRADHQKSTLNEKRNDKQIAAKVTH